ncbi:MAG: MarR family transcriptional regulator [Gemmatimonadales bacterium]|nr:MarR family transcriptional regulator [Gemmatimonadales bacterium]NIN11140.1 MarR family transcriptional regulator [Gemmatimonadales bacterium]NIN49739.1 MarR family transcriptional regulator [Gemmatimonadales bacterium]NIP07203.1 MarR family transcriptional regulator [Gemmatimonadales bacterium]NIR00416.1 MarR family transcriptional regulator [Gemmatimonadales bacterium]
MLTFLSPIHKANRQISVYFEDRLKNLEVSPQEGHLLSYLRSYAPCPIAEVVRVFGLKQSTLTSMLDRLEERKLIGRKVNPEDRRSFVISLTAEGRRFADRLHKLVEELERRLGDMVSANDVEGFRSVMAAIDEVTQVKLRER